MAIDGNVANRSVPQPPRSEPSSPPERDEDQPESDSTPNASEPTSVKAVAPSSAPESFPPASARPSSGPVGWFKDTFSVQPNGKRPPVSLGMDVGVGVGVGVGQTNAFFKADTTSLTKTDTTPIVANGPQTPPPVAAPEAVQPPPTISGEERAKQDVDVKTVAEDRESVNKTKNALRDETSKKANEIFSGGQPPPGTTVNKLNDNEAELVRVDASGNVLERTRATRGADGSVSLDSTSYKDGVNTHTKTEALADGGSRVREARWKSDQSEINTQPSFEDIEKSRDAKFTYTDNQVNEKDGKLTVDEYAQSQGAVKGSQTTFFTQRNGDNLNGSLQGSFKLDQDIDRASTHTYSIPAPGADGKQPPPEYQRIERFSQGDVQATSIASSELRDDDPKHDVPMPEEGKHYWDYMQRAGQGNHTREDLNRVRDGHTDMWKGQFGGAATKPGAPPRRWLVETKPDQNTYRSQTFVEGVPNASIVTERKLNGNTVTESYAGKTFAPDGKELVFVSGQSTSAYGADGKLDKLDVTRKDRDGSRQEHHYTRTTENTPEGVKYTEKTDSKLWDKDNKETSTLQEKVSLKTAQGQKDVSLRSEVTNATGTAIHEVNEAGDKLTFKNAQGEVRDISDASQIPNGDVESLITNAVAGSKALSEGAVGGLGLADKFGKANGAIGAQKITDALNAAKGATKMYEGLVGLTGVLGAGLSLHKAIQDKDAAAKGLASLQVAGAGMELTAAGSAAFKALSTLSVFERMGTAGAVLGGIAGFWEGVHGIHEGLEAGLDGQVAKGAVDVVAGVGAIGAAVLGAPIIGAAIGVGGFLIKDLIDLLSGDKYKIGELTIDDESFSLPQEPPPEDPKKKEEPEPVVIPPA